MACADSEFSMAWKVDHAFDVSSSADSAVRCGLALSSTYEQYTVAIALSVCKACKSDDTDVEKALIVLCAYCQSKW
jgi:hypothetical protein